VTDLELKHAELRAALRIAGMEIRKLNFGRRDSPVLQLLRRVYLTTAHSGRPKRKLPRAC